MKKKIDKKKDKKLYFKIYLKILSHYRHIMVNINNKFFIFYQMDNLFFYIHKKTINQKLFYIRRKLT